MPDVEPKESGSNEPAGMKLELAPQRSLVLLALGIGFVVLVVQYFSGATELWRAVTSAWLPGIAWALAALGLSMVVAAFRWCSVLSAMGYSLSIWKALGILLSTWPFSIVAPSRANDFLRARALRGLVPGFTTAGSVLAERAVDVQVLCWLALGGALLAGKSLVAATALGGAIGEVVAVVLLLRMGSKLSRREPFGRYRTKLDQLAQAFVALACAPRSLASVFAASAGVWLLNVAVLLSLALAFSASVGWREVLALWPIAIFVGLLPVSLGGLGTRDGAFLLLLRGFSPDDVSESGVLASTLGYAFLTTWLLAIIGVPFAIRWLGGTTNGLHP
jgi:uncharacterized membrane protein YbhN (UPF0104 family)